MDILITGINGLVGKGIAQELKQNNDINIIGIGRQKKCSHEWCDKYIDIDIISDDFFKNIINYVKSISVVIHCAALFRQNENPNEIIKINCGGTYNLAKLAKILQADKFFYISSVPIIGQPKNLPIGETHPIDPPSLYHYTKFWGEQILQLKEFNDVNSYIFRICAPISLDIPNDRMISVFFKKSLNNETIEVFNNGKRIQNYINTKDVGRAIKLAILTKHTCGTYNIIGEHFADLEIAELIKNITKSKSKIKLIDAKPEYVNEEWIVSGEKARANFGYNYQYSLEGLLQEMLLEQSRK